MRKVYFFGSILFSLYSLGFAIWVGILACKGTDWGLWVLFGVCLLAAVAYGIIAYDKRPSKAY